MDLANSPTTSSSGLTGFSRVSSVTASEVAALKCSKDCFRKMARDYLRRLKRYLLEIEMGVVWGLAGLAMIIFVFASIWFIDPALLTLVLQFRLALKFRLVRITRVLTTWILIL